MQVLGERYRLVERLGAGGMSVVWRGFDEVLRRPVAVKVLASSYVSDRASRERIRDEAHAAAVLSHPNITSVYDYGESAEPDGTLVPYVVMELVHGRSLLRHLADGPLPWRAALRVCAQVAAALAAAHARGLVHRDIKPANVMLTPAGVKVVDFGIAAIAGEAGDITPEGMLFGTPAYLAPERLDGLPVEPASDVYALGVLLYRTLTGGLPWNAASTAEVVTAHRFAEPRPLPPIDGLPAEVSRLYRRCLAKAPADRPTGREAARALASAATADPQPVEEPLTADEEPYPLEIADGPDGATAGDDTALVPRNPGVVSRRTAHGRRKLVRAGAAGGVLVVLALGVVTCSAVSGGSGERAAVAAGANRSKPSPTGEHPACTVRYQTRTDSGGAFAVDVTVLNSGTVPVADWALSVTFPGGQRVSGARSVDASQVDATVVFSGTGDLPPGQQATFSFSGTYTAANPLPTVFVLNDVECSYVLSGATGDTLATGGPDPTGADVAAPPATPGTTTTGANQLAATDNPTATPKHSKKPKKSKTAAIASS